MIKNIIEGIKSLIKPQFKDNRTKIIDSFIFNINSLSFILDNIMSGPLYQRTWDKYNEKNISKYINNIRNEVNTFHQFWNQIITIIHNSNFEDNSFKKKIEETFKDMINYKINVKFCNEFKLPPNKAHDRFNREILISFKTNSPTAREILKTTSTKLKYLKRQCETEIEKDRNQKLK